MMKKRTNMILLALYGAGALIMIVTILVIRLRLDRVIEVAV